MQSEILQRFTSEIEVMLYFSKMFHLVPPKFRYFSISLTAHLFAENTGSEGSPRGWTPSRSSDRSQSAEPLLPAFLEEHPACFHLLNIWVPFYTLCSCCQSSLQGFSETTRHSWEPLTVVREPLTVLEPGRGKCGEARADIWCGIREGGGLRNPPILCPRTTMASLANQFCW